MRSGNRFGRNRSSREHQHEYRGSERFIRDDMPHRRGYGRRSRHYEPYDQYEYEYEEQRGDPDFDTDYSEEYGYAQRHRSVRRMDHDDLRYDIRDEQRYRGHPAQYDDSHFDDRRFHAGRRPGNRGDVASGALRGLWNERSEHDHRGYGEHYDTRRRNNHTHRQGSRRRRMFAW